MRHKFLPRWQRHVLFRELREEEVASSNQRVLQVVQASGRRSECPLVLRLLES